jgi:hypothetical protein
MIDQIFITYYVFAVVVVICTMLYDNVYGDARRYVFKTVGWVLLTAGISVVVHAVYYIWR